MSDDAVLGEWTPDCGGDWCLSGRRWFANYWPDNTVSASIYAGEEGDETPLATSGIMSGESRADCQRKAEVWIRAHLDDATPPVSAAPVVPAATDEPALAVIRDWIESMGYDDMGIEPASLVAALEANGYVVLPHDVLLPLLDAVPPVTVGERNSEDYALLHATYRAVVEAVGPTREDTK